MKHNSKQFNGYEFNFLRINVILGANGVGKSKFLAELRSFGSELTGGAKVVYVEGGRAIKIQDQLTFQPHNFSNYQAFDVAVKHYEHKRVTTLAERVFDALVVLDKKDGKLKAEHSDAVEQWIEGGQSGPCPKRKQPPLEHLFELFNELFPQISLSYNYETRTLAAQKFGQSYGPSSFSDGEKQVFSILADLIDLAEFHKLILVDEPELNLHPELAERLWTLIENAFTDKTFVYATHNINFALRENVESVHILSSESSNITEFTGIENLPRTELSALLGSLPGILSANRVIVTEGHEKSFDANFYRWLLDDPKVEVLPAGGCCDVTSIVAKSGLWEKISSRISLVGVIDSDFKNDTYLSSLRRDFVVLLPFHEAESYLCLPEVLCAIASRIGSQETPIATDEVESSILATLEKEKLLIAARRLFARSQIALAVSVERKLMAASSTREALVATIRKAAEGELAKAHVVIAPDQLEKDFDLEVAVIDKAIQSRDILSALRYIPGKQLLNKLAPRAGCKNGDDLMRSLRRNFKPSDFSKVADLAKLVEPTTPN